jgi:hypothetical protein
MVSAVIFIVVAVILCAAAVFAVLGIAQIYLSGAEAIEHDGLASGSDAPAWSLTDSSGTRHRSPPDKPLQLIMFTDHSLKSFPSVVDGLRAVMTQAARLEVIVLLRHRNEIAEPVLRMLGLGDIPVLTGSPALYGRYNVRVIPFAIIVDSAGQVRASSLVNHDWQITKLVQLADIPPEPPARPAASPFRLRPRAGVLTQWRCWSLERSRRWPPCYSSQAARSSLTWLASPRRCASSRHAGLHGPSCGPRPSASR